MVLRKRSQRRHDELPVDRLLGNDIENLVAAADNGTIAGSNAMEAGASARPYEPPQLEKYTDMQDLVLLDPVHEVDATGWPHPKPAET